MSEQTDIFDYQSLAAMMQNDQNIIQIIIESFISDMTLQINALEGQISSADIESAQKQCHKIKGASANIRANEMFALTTEMDKAGKAGDMQGISSRLDELKQAYQAFVDAAQSHMS